MAITLNSNTFESLDFVLDDLQDLEKDTNTTNSSLLNSSLCDFSALCIPDDPIEDITWLLPNFTDNNNHHHHYSKDENFSTSPNSLIDFPTTPEQETEFKGNKRGFGGLLDEVVQQQQEDGPVKKKQRSKRSGGRVWCLNANALLPKRRSCGHCGTVKTPQWREGPMGPKTLCNACGVRYKSGRLVPEYRPAASPTFDSQRHSNSHRKIVRMRMSRDTSM